MSGTRSGKIAIIAALAAIVAAITTGRLPRWLRITLVLGLSIFAAGAGLYAYRFVSQPTTLTVAAGSLDGDAAILMSTIATRLASTGAPLRLHVVDKGSVIEAEKPEEQPLMRLHALTDEIRNASNDGDLAKTEQQIDDILKEELKKYATGNAEAAETAAMGLATHRLEHLIAQRRALLNGKTSSAPKVD